MRTVTDTPDTLILEDRPWGLGIFIAVLMVVMCVLGIGMAAAGEPWGGATFFVGGLVMAGLSLWALVRHTQLWIDRPAGAVAHRVRTILGMTASTYPLSDLQRAETQATRGSKGQMLYRPVLVFGGETLATVQVIDAFASPQAAEAVAQVINTWLSRRA